MNIIKILSGILFFDEFEDPDLKTNWLIIPNKEDRYSLVERPGYLKLYHGTPNTFALIDEPSTSYILDTRNEYTPNNLYVQGGLTVFKTLDESLEMLEYYDETKDASIVYEYLRLVRSNNIYTGYGKNKTGDEWELIGSCSYKSAGKVGMVLKGYKENDSPSMDLEYFRLYKSHNIQVINVPIGYTVMLCNTLGSSIQARKVINSYNGITFTLDDIPPITVKFKVFDDLNNLLTVSDFIDVIGGDVYYYGAYPVVRIDGNSVLAEGEYFLGYFTDGEIDFVVTMENPYNADLTNVVISPLQYESDSGYLFVTFCNTIDGGYATTNLVGTIKTGETVTVYGKITRNASITPLTTEPFKFNLGITFV